MKQKKEDKVSLKNMAIWINYLIKQSMKYYIQNKELCLINFLSMGSTKKVSKNTVRINTKYSLFTLKEITFLKYGFIEIKEAMCLDHS